MAATITKYLKKDNQILIVYKIWLKSVTVLKTVKKVQLEECESNDEQIIPTKLWTPIEQYFPMKHQKWVIKG